MEISRNSLKTAGAGQNSNGNGKANGEGGENNPPNTSPPNAVSRRGQRRPAQNQASTGNATRDSRANASELEGLRRKSPFLLPC